MTQQKFIKAASLKSTEDATDAKKVSEVCDLPHCRMVEVILNDHDTLSKHKANEPISVLCLAGSGYFTAGSDLADRQRLEKGTLITLDAGVEHEVTADDRLQLLVTKFKQYS